MKAAKSRTASRKAAKRTEEAPWTIRKTLYHSGSPFKTLSGLLLTPKKSWIGY